MPTRVILYLAASSSAAFIVVLWDSRPLRIAAILALIIVRYYGAKLIMRITEERTRDDIVGGARAIRRLRHREP